MIQNRFVATFRPSDGYVPTIRRTRVRSVLTKRCSDRGAPGAG